MSQEERVPAWQRWLAAAAALLVLALLVFNLSYKLPDQVVLAFDEGRHIASAMEMRQTHDFLANRYQGQLDYYNAKPPLSIWAAALTVGLWPDPFVGVRLFSLLAALGTALLVFCYARRMADFAAGLLAVLLLFTAPLLLEKHGARTADPDMLYVLLVTAALPLLARATTTGIAWAYVMLGLAFLTKSFHAAPFGIAAFVYCLGLRWRGQISTKALLLPLWALVPVLPWALARAAVDGTRFFHVMIFYDLIARTTTTVETHFQDPMAYVNSLGITFGPALLALVICLFSAPARRALGSRHGLLLLCWLLVPLALYSVAKSRLYWYVFPLLPPAALLLAVGIAAARGSVHRVAYTVALVVVAFNLVINEQNILDYVGRYSWADDPREQALRQLSADARPGRVGVFMADEQTFGQGRYATALLLGNIDLRGTPEDFARRAAPGDVLLRSDGSVQRQAGSSKAASRPAAF